MDEIKCPYCNNFVNKKYENYACPICGYRVMSEEFISQRVVSITRIMKKRKIFDRIQQLVWDNDMDHAKDAIRTILEVCDPAMETAIINFLLKSKPDEEQEGCILTQPKKPMIALIACSACGTKISSRATSCPHCGNPTGIHVCPKCNGVNTRVISETSKAASIFLWGVFAANKVVSKFECEDCGHKF